MKHKGPILTLAAGLVLAAVLMVLNLRATDSQTQNASGEAAAETVATTAPAKDAPPSPTAAPTKAAETVTYAGNVKGGAATIAIAVKGEQAIAYLCDGKRTEAWLQGSARNGELVLSGAGSAKLTGTISDGVAEGSVNAAGRRFTFAVKPVKKPSGLYRATANVANAQIVEGWIVLENGQRVTGGMNRDGVSGPATELKLPEATTVVDGTTIQAGTVDPGAGI